MNKTLALAGALALTLGISTSFAAAGPDPTEGRFRDLYKELVETNTTLSSGSCTLAAERMMARLKAAGYPDEDFHPFTVPDHPKEGGLVFVSPGREIGRAHV